MVCLYCGHETQVTNSRLQRRANHVWRRRTCPACAGTFTTSEQPVLETALLVTSKNSRKAAAFSRDTLFIALYESCRHRTNSIQDAAYLTDIVIGRILALQQNGAVDRDDITRSAIEALERFDPAAAVMYAAYHPL